MTKWNSYYCARCGELTRHVEIDFSEEISHETQEFSQTGKALGKIGGIFLDLTGVGFALKTIGVFRPYKCCKCGRITDRDFDGTVKQHLGG